MKEKVNKNTEAAILEAAEGLFKTNGFKGTTTTMIAREFDTLKSKIFDRVRSELFFLSNLFSIFVVYISKYCEYETCN